MREPSIYDTAFDPATSDIMRVLTGDPHEMGQQVQGTGNLLAGMARFRHYQKSVEDFLQAQAKRGWSLSPEQVDWVKKNWHKARGYKKISTKDPRHKDAARPTHMQEYADPSAFQFYDIDSVVPGFGQNWGTGEF